PDWPPNTPKPPKNPPPPPDPPPNPPVVAAEPRRRPLMANRPGAAWAFESAPWVASRAARAVTEQITAWRLPAPEGTGDVVKFLVRTAVADGGRRISVHVSEQNRLVLVLALSHRPHPAPLDPAVLTRLHRLGPRGCGSRATADGRETWAIIDTAA
ncbi:hypothetical protein, partial [Streptomyces clavuligerus]